MYNHYVCIYLKLNYDFLNVKIFFFYLKDLCTYFILYFQLNFPVNPDEMQLMEELEEKLDIAALAGQFFSGYTSVWP